MSTVRISVAGESTSVEYSTRTVTPLPSMPEVTYSSLSPVSNEHLGKTLKRLGSEARVYLPTGTYPIFDNADINHYSVYAPKARGLRGDGIGKTVIRVQPNTFTYFLPRPKTSGDGLMRLGPNGGAGGVVRSISDLSIIGAPNIYPVALGGDDKPTFAQGVWNYFGRGEVWKNVYVRGVSYGGGNSPNTGETFMVNDYRTVDSLYEDCDFDGRDEAGNMISASPIGFNGAVNATLRRCYIHHSLYSGLTFSIAGTVATPTNGVYTEDCVIEMNANHPNVGSGSRFSGMNHEWVRGQITHVRPNISLDQAKLWDSNHISHGCDQIEDNPVPMVVVDPTWNASPTWANGLFTIKFWGNQRTLPIVKNGDGSLKKPVVVIGQNPPRLGATDSDGKTITPETHFALLIDTGYGAP